MKSYLPQKHSKRQRKLKGQSRIDNPGKMGILGTQDMGRTKTLEKTEGTVMNGQSRETGSTHWVQKTQNKTKHNTILKE